MRDGGPAAHRDEGRSGARPRGARRIAGRVRGRALKQSGVAFAFAAGIGLAARLAHAEGRPAVTLQYERAADAADCPDESALRRSIADRLGYDPFVSTSASRVVARVHAASGGHAGTVNVTREGSPPSAERSLFEAGDCHELIQTMALTISIALDPSSFTSPPPPKAEPAPPAKPADAHPSTTTFSLGVGPSLSMGDSPAPVIGGVLSANLRHDEWFGAVLDLGATLPGSKDTALGTVSSWSGRGLTAACLHSSWLFGCAAVMVGFVRAQGQFEGGRSVVAPSLYAGPRLGVAVPLGTRLELRVQADGLWALARHRLAIGAREAYEYSPGMLAGSALLGVRL